MTSFGSTQIYSDTRSQTGLTIPAQDLRTRQAHFSLLTTPATAVDCPIVFGSPDRTAVSYAGIYHETGGNVVIKASDGTAPNTHNYSFEGNGPEVSISADGVRMFLSGVVTTPNYTNAVNMTAVGHVSGNFQRIGNIVYTSVSFNCNITAAAPFSVDFGCDQFAGVAFVATTGGGQATAGGNIAGVVSALGGTNTVRVSFGVNAAFTGATTVSFDCTLRIL